MGGTKSLERIIEVVGKQNALLCIIHPLDRKLFNFANVFCAFFSSDLDRVLILIVAFRSAKVCLQLALSQGERGTEALGC